VAHSFTSERRPEPVVVRSVHAGDPRP